MPKKDISEEANAAGIGEKEITESGSKRKEGMLTLTDKVRGNPWVVSTFVLGAIVVILLIGNFPMTGGAVGVASQDDVKAKLNTFLDLQTSGAATLDSISLKDGFYEALVTYQGTQIPIYVTSDGKNLVQGLTPIDELINASQNSNTQQASQPTAVPKSDKPVVELFVMSMCPYGTQAEKGLISALETLGNKIDFKLRFVSYAMHGKNEVDQNTVQYCIQKQEPAKLLTYLKCYLNEGTPEAWSVCLTEAKIDKTKLNTCISATDKEFKITELYNDKSTWNGGTYPQYNTDLALNQKYSVQGSPTLVINGVQSNAGRDSASYLAGICAAFNTAPSECQAQLSNSAPSPGFGWTTTAAASTTAAQCG